MGQVDRREFLQKAGVASAAAGAVWAAPSVLGASTAFAEGSVPPDSGPVITAPDTSACLVFDWGATQGSEAISASGSGANSNVLTADDNSTTVTVTSAFVGTAPPTIDSTYRNMWVHNTPVSGDGTISGYGDAATQAGLILVQKNWFGGNHDPSSVTNYQEVTFTFSAPVTSLTFTIYDLSANSSYQDLVGFDATPTVLNDTASTRSFGDARRTGTGTFADPLRRTTTDDWYWGADLNNPDHNVPLDVTVRFAGPLTSLTMRYSSIWTRRATQFIKIGDMQTGGCQSLLPRGA